METLELLKGCLPLLVHLECLKVRIVVLRFLDLLYFATSVPSF